MNLKNKKILIICNSFPNKDGKYSGGAFVKSQVIEIAKYFKEVNVISPIARSLKLESRDKYCQNYTINNIKVHYPRYFHLPTKQFRNKLGENQLKVIKKIIKKNKIQFDLIHGHHTWPGGFVAVKLKENYNKKVLVTAHGFDVYDLPFKNNFWNAKIKDVLKKTDKIITVSESNKKCLKKLGYDYKTTVIPNGFDEKKFFHMKKKNKIKEELNVPKNKKILLHVGNLVPVKNHQNLLKGIKELTKKRKDFILYCVGGGVEEKNLKKQVRTLKIESYVKFTGPKKHEEIPFWMNAADLFVLPSFSEGNPTVMFESLGCGLPYVGTNVGGVGEIITSDKYGLIYENPNDYKELAQLIDRGLKKKWNPEEILKYSKQFSWKNISKQIISEYKKLL